jgi:mono/diheme cytochrome c family protein
MNEQEQKEYLEQYKEAKKKGVPFFPDVVFKDAIVSVVVLVIILALIYLAGVPLEARANPADTSYTPRPEWYFLFLFQLLKYFPGQLEVIGVFILPTIFLILLFALPFIDRGPERHAFDRPLVTGGAGLVMVGIIVLTVLAVVEAPPPSEETRGDPVATLYTQNCAGCHGPSITISARTTNLHEIIAQGGHNDAMPAWSGDLTTDEIDALVGFISSPSGSRLFNEFCAECHQAPELVASDPIQLKQALETGQAFAPHSDQDIPGWQEVMTTAERTDLLNFLIAPDGQRLFVTNCSSCHGKSVSFDGDQEQLRQIIEDGGLHLNMPAWRGRLPQDQLASLAAYVVDPLANPQAEGIFRQNCSTCHGALVPRAENTEQAMQTILTGGAHETMPVWGQVLTDAQLTALTQYTLAAAEGTSLEDGRRLFQENCSSCHGEFGEGGPNPTRAGDVIAPISSAEYLRTRDDVTLEAIISQGQPNFGMSPFGSAYGGPLDDDQIQAIIDYIRSWEENPPVELPPEVQVESIALSGGEIYADLCAQCHGEQGQGLIGPSLADAEFQTNRSDDEIFKTINEGHPATAMIGWGEVLTSEQIEQLVTFIRSLDQSEPQGDAPQEVSFSADILPLFESACSVCHGSFGGWDSSSYQSVMTTGDNAPVVEPGSPENSLLLHKMEGTQDIGDIMPPGGLLPADQVALIRQWIEAGAPDN